MLYSEIITVCCEIWVKARNCTVWAEHSVLMSKQVVCIFINQHQKKGFRGLRKRNLWQLRSSLFVSKDELLKNQFFLLQRKGERRWKRD
jgi:hypothetical protein